MITVATTGDFDIDAAGQLRTTHQGRLRVYTVGGWTLLSTVTLLRDLFAPSALVHR